MEPDRLTVLMDGKEQRSVSFNPTDFRQFDHGYAVPALVSSTSRTAQTSSTGRSMSPNPFNAFDLFQNHLTFELPVTEGDALAASDSTAFLGRPWYQPPTEPYSWTAWVDTVIDYPGVNLAGYQAWVPGDQSLQNAHLVESNSQCYLGSGQLQACNTSERYHGTVFDSKSVAETNYAPATFLADSDGWNPVAADPAGSLPNSTVRNMSYIAFPTSINLSWSVPLTLNGASVTDYVINYRDITAGPAPGLGFTNIPWTTIDTGSAALNATINPLVTGHTYQIKIYPIESGGTQSAPGLNLASAPIDVTCAPSVPGQPQLGGASPGSGNVQLIWGIPTFVQPGKTNQGAPTGWTVNVRSVQNGAIVEQFPLPAQLVDPVLYQQAGYPYYELATIGGQTFGSTLWYSVVATNSAGSSIESNELSATVLASGAMPPALVGVTATAPSGSSISVSWQADSSNDATFINAYPSGSTTVAAQTTVPAGQTTGTLTGP